MEFPYFRGEQARTRKYLSMLCLPILLIHCIRAPMQSAFLLPLKGIVEVDETFVGCKVSGKGRGYKGNKAIVMGAVQREGK